MMKDKLILYNDYSIINKKCFCCSSYTHSVNNCPKTHYYPDHERIIKKKEFTKDHLFRTPFKRRQKKINSLKFLKLNSTFKLSSFLKQIEHSGSLDPPDVESSSSLAEIMLVEEKNPKEKRAMHSNNLDNPSELGFFSNEKVVSEKEIIKTLESSKKQLIIPGNSVASMQGGVSELQDFEKVENYSNYFPEKNIFHIVKELNNLRRMGRNKMEETESKKRYENFGKYTFYADFLIEKFFKEQEIKKNKKNNTIFLDILSPASKNNEIYAQSSVIDVKRVNRKRRTTFFKGLPSSNQKIYDFTNLIATLIKRTKDEKKKICELK